jgi:hypothetical protein
MHITSQADEVGVFLSALSTMKRRTPSRSIAVISWDENHFSMECEAIEDAWDNARLHLRSLKPSDLASSDPKRDLQFEHSKLEDWWCDKSDCST